MGEEGNVSTHPLLGRRGQRLEIDARRPPGTGSALARRGALALGLVAAAAADEVRRRGELVIVQVAALSKR